MELQCYVQLFVFTFLTSATFRTLRSAERALPQRVLLSFSTGWETKRPRVQKHVPSHAAKAKREAFFCCVFFFTVLDHLPTAHKHRNTQSHTSTRAVCCRCGNIYPLSSDCVFSIVWPCICILIEFFCPTHACCCRWMRE